jgi:hypothetical protein
MGSTVCVRCGANLIPYSYCDVCHDVLCFICSSCSMNTIERIHAYCHNTSTLSDNLQDSLELMEEPIVINNNYINTHYYIQNQLNDKIKDNSIKLSTSYWDSMFEAIKLVNTYWNRIFNIGNPSQNISWN